jgi:hypothetical protein
MRRTALTACVLAVCGVGACGGSDTDGAREAAQGYVTNLGERDGKGTCEQMTTGLQRQFTAAVGRTNREFRGRSCAQIMQAALETIPAEQLRQFSGAKIENLKVDGDKGTFRYKLDQIQVDGQVAKEDGDWKVSCCVPGAGAGAGG